MEKQKFRKKPVVIEAYQTNKEMTIHTLEGEMLASVGDWIITGVNGEQYPCKPDVFEKTYERVLFEFSIDYEKAWKKVMQTILDNMNYIMNDAPKPLDSRLQHEFITLKTLRDMMEKTESEYMELK